ncbi:MAG: glycosyltransferase family 2 protein, partial [Stackebrandtia sp.]
MSAPDVSVVVGAYNAMPYLTQCVESVLGQSLGARRLELIVVDDGSADGTGAELDRLAARHPAMRVVRQENSGGPAAPRNRGMKLARGRYVFFLDADDWLGEEALERMLSAAEANGADIVLGKMVGAGGRVVPKSMFECDQPRTDVFDSRVYWALNPLKLFRRDFLRRNRLRFPVDLPIGQDQPFVALAYLRARVISVVAGYDCYYARLRDDGLNNTRRPGGAVRRLPFLRAVFALLAAEVEAGPRRDQLLRRHFQSDQREFLEHLDRETDPRARQAAFEGFRELVDAWCSPAVADSLPAADRLRLELIRRGRPDEALRLIRFTLDGDLPDLAIESGRVLAAYPGFREPKAELPDALFDVTAELPVNHRIDEARWRDGRFVLRGVLGVDRLDNSAARVLVVLRERDSAAEHLVAARTEGDAASTRWRVEIDPGTAASGAVLPDGLWDVFARIECRGVARTVRVGRFRADDVDAADQRLLDAADGKVSRLVVAYYTQPYGNLTFDVGGRLKPWWGSRPPRAAWD